MLGIRHFGFLFSDSGFCFLIIRFFVCLISACDLLGFGILCFLCAVVLRLNFGFYCFVVGFDFGWCDLIPVFCFRFMDTLISGVGI